MYTYDGFMLMFGRNQQHCKAITLRLKFKKKEKSPLVDMERQCGLRQPPCPTAPTPMAKHTISEAQLLPLTPD